MTMTIDRPATRVDLRVKIGPLTLVNPILTASGTFGYAIELAHLTDLSRLGGIATKGISPRPRFGNPTPRMCETASGMINSIGLENVGVEGFRAVKAPALAKIDTCVDGPVLPLDELAGEYALARQGAL